MKTKLISLLCFLSLLGSVLVLPAAGAEMPDPSTLYKKKDVNAEWEEKDATVVDLSSLNGPFEITGDGEYVLRGQTSFPVVVNAAEEDDVRLILDGASIITASGPAVRENAADKLIVTLADGSVNVLTSQSILEENGEKYSAALYAKDDLSINGTGALTVESAAGHGIQSKADLIVAGGTLQVTAGKDGLRGKNSVTLLGGDMTVVSGGDGVTTTRDDKPDKGWIVMIDGTLRVTSGGGAGEGITLDTALGALSPDGQGGFGAGWKSREKEPASDMPSQKGIKAQTSLTVAGGTLDLNCADDALHAASIAVALNHKLDEGLVPPLKEFLRVVPVGVKMRREADGLYALPHRGVDHGPADVYVLRPVVYAGKDVAVEVDEIAERVIVPRPSGVTH